MGLENNKKKQTKFYGFRGALGVQRSPHTRGSHPDPTSTALGTPMVTRARLGGDPIKQFGGGTPQTGPETPHGDPKCPMGDSRRPMGTLNALLGTLNTPWGPWISHWGP